MARTKVVRFDDFTGGEFGNVGASAAPDKSFTGVNMMRYRNGLLGPRPGLKNLDVTSAPTGVVWGMKGVGSYVVFGVSNTVYKFSYPSPGAVSSVGTLSSGAPGAGVQPCQIIQFGADGYLSVKDDKCYKLDPAGGTVTQYASSVAGHAVGIFNERLVVAGRAGANSSRVDASAGGLDFTTWPAAANFDISSPDWDAIYVDELRNRMVIANTGSEWWTMTGDIELAPTIKRTPREDLAPGAWYNVARMGESVFFAPAGEDFPVQFTGTVTDKDRFEHLHFTGSAGNPVVAAALQGAGFVSFVENAAVTTSTVQLGGTPRMLLFGNGVWSYHLLGVATSKFVSPVSEGGLAFASNPLILTDGGGASDAPVFYSFDPYLDRPGKAGDTTAQPGDASTTPLTASVSFPEWWTPDGSEAIVRSVSIDFAKWDTGSSSTNHFDLNVTALHRYNSSGIRASTTHSWDEAASSTLADETLHRQVFRMGDQGVGHGFQLAFTNVRGVALRRVTVEVDQDPPRQG